MKKFAIPVGAAVCSAVFLFSACKEKTMQCSKTEPENEVICGYGFIRGSSRTTLYNKYGAYVSKVHYYSNARVKKGDCILEYDDFDLRKKIVSQTNSIANLRREIRIMENQFQLTRLNPLPSDYRNTSWKTKKAKELLDRTENEFRTYERLFKSQSVSELDLRSKKQAFLDALASYKIALSDQEKVNRGLTALYIKASELELAALKTKLAGAEKELELLHEERKFYKITTPYDGIIVTNSDTVHIWDDPGTAAAVIHRSTKGFYIYSYFEEKDLIHIPDGTPARFFSNDSGKWYDLKSFEITRTRTTSGDKVFHLVKFKVLSPVEPDLRKQGKGIRMDGNGIVEIKIKRSR